MALLEIDRVTKSYGGLVALQDVTFEIEPNEIVALIGPNGAGKTTMFDVITGVSPVTKGEVRFRGKSISGLLSHRISRLGIGRTFQIPRPFSAMTVRENIMVGAMACGTPNAEIRKRTDRILELTHLAHYVDSCASSLTLIGQKRLEIARALSVDPSIILLDEVLAGLRTAELDEALDLIRSVNQEQKVAVLLVEHVMRAVMAISQRVVVLHYGKKIAEGAPTEIAKNHRVIASYLGDSSA